MFQKIIWLFLCLLPYSLFAQEPVLDYVYTKNGSRFVGEIVTYEVGGILQLKINDGTIIFLDDATIKKIVQNGNEKKYKDKVHKPYEFRETGWYGFAAGSINGSRSAFEQEGTAGLGIQAGAGYRWNRWLGVGVGLGMDYYYPGSGENIMPLVAELRGYLNAKNTAPYYVLQAGYGFAFTDTDNNIIDATGGVHLYPAIGLRCGASSNVNFTIDMGIKYQEASYEFERWERLTHAMIYRRMILRVGIVF